MVKSLEDTLELGRASLAAWLGMIPATVVFVIFSVATGPITSRLPAMSDGIFVFAAILFGFAQGFIAGLLSPRFGALGSAVSLVGYLVFVAYTGYQNPMRITPHVYLWTVIYVLTAMAAAAMSANVVKGSSVRSKLVAALPWLKSLSTSYR